MSKTKESEIGRACGTDGKEKKINTGILLRSEEMEHLEDLLVDGRIILKCSGMD
jgi:hypothetical protein